MLVFGRRGQDRSLFTFLSILFAVLMFLSLFLLLFFVAFLSNSLCLNLFGACFALHILLKEDMKLLITCTGGDHSGCIWGSVKGNAVVLRSTAPSRAVLKIYFGHLSMFRFLIICHCSPSEPQSPDIKILQGRALYGPIPVKTETFREL